jgi:hypothetical protein
LQYAALGQISALHGLTVTLDAHSFQNWLAHFDVDHPNITNFPLMKNYQPDEKNVSRGNKIKINL